MKQSTRDGWSVFGAFTGLGFAAVVGVYSILILLGVVEPPSERWTAFAAFAGYGLGIQAGAHREAKKAGLE